MTPAVLAELVRSTALRVLDDRGLDTACVPDVVVVQRAPGRGDYATNLALRLGGRVGVAPTELAAWLADAVRRERGIDAAEVAGPGFVNLRLTAQARGEIVRDFLVPPRWEPFALPEPARELVGAIGGDAARYAVALVGDLTVNAVQIARWRGRTDANPVYHAQYAYTRLSSLLRNARDLALAVPDPETPDLDLGLLIHHREGELIGTIGEFPRVVAARQAHRLARCLDELASAVAEFDANCRVLPPGDEEPGPLTTARLALCVAARNVLGAGLGLLSVTAPERM